MTPQAEPARLLYLEPDDEITSVIRRLREADPGRVVLVASGRTKATTSAVALRLLAGVATEDGREIALVADANGRALAAEAGIPAFASVADASAEGAAPVAPPPAPRAPIRVVRGEPVAPVPTAALGPTEPSEERPSRTSGPGDETQAVPAPPPPVPAPAVRRARRPAAPRAAGLPFGRRLPRVAIGVLIGLVLLAGAALAAVAPAATVVIVPASVQLDPTTYTLSLAPDGTDEGELSGEAQGTATGTFSDPSTASGAVTIYNYTYVTVEIPQGMRVSADGEVFFTTTERVIAPPGDFVGGNLQPGQISVGVVAEEAGPSGNVAEGAINRVENQRVDSFLKGFPGLTGRRVSNPDPTSGGDNNEQPQVTQDDVNAAVAAIQANLTEQLQGQLVEDPSRVYGPADAGDPAIDVPPDLVGRTGEETFTLSGSVAYRRPYLQRDAVQQAAVQRLLADGQAAGEGMEILADTAQVTIGDVTEAGDQLRLRVTVRAQATPAIDVDAVRNQVAGMTDLQAIDALGNLGGVSVKLWPDWIDRIPQLTWRIEVRVEETATPSPSVEASP